MQHGLPPVIAVGGGGDGTRLARSTRIHWPRRPWRAGRRCGNHPDNHAGHRDRPRSRETRRRCARITATGGDTSSLGAEADVIQRSWRPRWPTRPMLVSRQTIIEDPRSDHVHLSLCSWSRRPKFENTQLPRLCPAGCDRFCLDPPRSPRGTHFFGGIGHCWLRSSPQPLSPLPVRRHLTGKATHCCDRPPHVAPHHRQHTPIRLRPAVAPLKWLAGHVWGGVDPSIAVCSILPVRAGTERNQDRLSAIHSAGYVLMANRIPS